MVETLAPAKVNLCLRVYGKTNSGLHNLDSIVVFCQFGDKVSISSADHDSFFGCGPFAPLLTATNNEENLVITARDAFRANGGVCGPIAIILDKEIKVTATAVRIPVMGGHSESVNIEFKNSFVISDVKSILSTMSGVTVQDNISELLYPMPFYSGGKDEVFVGRLRRDESQERTLNMWIVADNLRKGAATNAVQIAEYLVREKICE